MKMMGNPSKSASISRTDAIDLLRTELMQHTDRETSLCMAAANKGIFCKGYKALTEEDLRERYAWIVRKRPDVTRQDLESIGNLWQLTQQEVHGLPCACDVQSKLGDTCQGWREFSNDELSRHYFNLTRRVIQVA